MYSYETQIGGTIVKLTHDPDARSIVGTALSPGGEPIDIDLACPYRPEDMGPHWIDFAHYAASLAAEFPKVSRLRVVPPPEGGSQQQQEPPAEEEEE